MGNVYNSQRKNQFVNSVIFCNFAKKIINQQ
jgi:hypothetical protein